MAKQRKPAAKRPKGEAADAPTGQANVMPDIPAGLEKIIDSQLAKRVYSDGLSKPLRASSGLATNVINEASELATDVLKGLRLFTLPFVLAANFRDRLAADLDKCRKRVPEERQVESPPEIAGPVIERLRFLDDINPLREMYLNLLTTSIDAARQSTAHPAFVSILSQMSPDEARLLDACSCGQGHLKHPNDVIMLHWGTPDWLFTRDHLSHSRPVSLAFPGRLDMYLRRLASFQLLVVDGVHVDEAFAFCRVVSTAFGRLFFDACAASGANPNEEPQR